LTKLSLGFYLLRIMNPTALRRRRLCSAIMLTSTLVNTAHFAYRLSLCRSSPSNTDIGNFDDTTSIVHHPAEGSCDVNSKADVVVMIVAAMINICADVGFVLLPLPEMIRALRQRRMWKLVFVIVVLAAAGVVVSVVRVPLLHGYLASGWSRYA
jgi:hypothetical protein